MVIAMEEILLLISGHFEEIISVILFAIGFTTLMISKNLIKKIIGLNIMDTAVYLFLASKGYITGASAPIIVNGNTDASNYINPIPSALVLTGIVVSVSVTAVLLAITMRLYRRYHTLDIDEIMMHYANEVEG